MVRVKRATKFYDLPLGPQLLVMLGEDIGHSSLI